MGEGVCILQNVRYSYFHSHNLANQVDTSKTYHTTFVQVFITLFQSAWIISVISDSFQLWTIACQALLPGEQSRVLSPNSTGGLTPFRPFLGSKGYPSWLERRAESIHSLRDEAWLPGCNPSLWHLPKETEDLYSYKKFHIAFFFNCQNLEATKMPFNRWTYK